MTRILLSRGAKVDKAYVAGLALHIDAFYLEIHVMNVLLEHQEYVTNFNLLFFTCVLYVLKIHKCLINLLDCIRQGCE